MYKYEFGHIIECESKKDEEIQKIIGEVRQIISDLNGRIVKEDVRGKQELTYPINKQNHGFYMFTTMMMEPFAVVEFEKKLKLLDGSMRYLLINLDKEPGYGKQIAADEGDNEKIKTRKPEEKTEEEDGKTEAKGTKKKMVAEMINKHDEEVEPEPVKIKKEEKKFSKKTTDEADKKVKKTEEEKPVKKEKEEKKEEDSKKYDELLDKKLSEIL